MSDRLSHKPNIPSAELLQRVVELCLERKADDVTSLDCRGLVEYMDHMVIVTGRGPRQNRAVGEHVATMLKREHGLLPFSKAGMDGGTWICLDFVDVVLHVFDNETRAVYDLELLWGDAKRTDYAPLAPSDTEHDESETDEAPSDDEASSDDAEPTSDVELARESDDA